MSVLNRIVTMLALILGWLVVVLLAAVPELALEWARLGLDWVEQFLSSLAGLRISWLYPVLRVAVILLATAILVSLLWLELRRKRPPAVKVQLPSGGQAAVTADSVSRRLAWHIDQLADIIAVEPTVMRRGGGVEVHLQVETAPDVDVPMKTEEVMAVTRDVIETQMGLQLRKVKVDLSHAAFPDTL